MGEKEEMKNDGEKPAEGGEKKEVELITVMLKMDLHCEGCANKVRRSINHFEGVKNVKVDYATNKLTVTGNFDPTWLREKVELKTKKKVDLVSPLPKKEAATIADGGDKKPDDKLEKKEEAKKDDNSKPKEKPEKKDETKKDDDKKPKEPVTSTLVMKIRLHCDGCAHKIKRTILKNIGGVSSVDANLEKNLVTVIGTMDAKDLTAFLKEKLKRGVEIVSPKKDDGGGEKKANESGKEKKEKSGGGGAGEDTKEKEKKKETGGEKKDGGEGTRGVEGPKVEINKLTVQTFNPQTHYVIPMHNQNYIENHQEYATQMQIYQNQHYPGSSNGYMVQYPHGHGNETSSHVGYAISYSQGPPQSGYMSHYPMGPPPPPPAYLNINDQMFSDENPDGCSIM